MRDADRPGWPRGEKVWLRAFEREDLEPYLLGANSAAAGIDAGYAAPLGRTHGEAWFEKRVNGEHGRGAYYFVISPIGGREFLGTLWLWNGDSRFGGLELSIFVLPSAGHGQGIGTDAVRAGLDFGFGNTDVERIWLYTKERNTRAQRVFEKAGFRREGLLRHHSREHGQWQSMALMSILRGEWEAETRPRSWELAGAEVGSTPP